MTTDANKPRLVAVPEPDCAKCRHFYITYEANFPYGCRVLGFKSRRKPQLDVLAASGNPCLSFQKRVGKKK